MFLTAEHKLQVQIQLLIVEFFMAAAAIHGLLGSDNTNG